MNDPPPQADLSREHRPAIARHRVELHRPHLALAADNRRLKALTEDGHGLAEAEMIEQYLAATGAVVGDMRGRFEARLPPLRRAAPRGAERTPGQGASGHGPFWCGFFRPCAAPWRAERRVG
jgi:hypothetical protein